MALARMQAVARSAYVALKFDGTGSETSVAMFVVGNRNGVRTRDITAGIDRQIDAPARLAEMFPGVSIGLSTIAGRGEAVRIGSSRLLSFSPISTATSGTIYVRGRDGTQLAVRVVGSTGRTRLLRYLPRTGEWIPF
ncbi:MAG: hypothetical protein HY657_00935 [Acidobacteria bacterium]|nr:hypothetical protein [Acidobacteriota bacterium]